MKMYPEIQGPNRAPREPCIAFEKYDGSNLRFEWSKKRGWYKFGTRHTLFDERDETWGSAIKVFHETYAEGLEKVFREHKIIRQAQNVVAFCEFFGPNSFAGFHRPEDEKELVLFDVNVHKRGIMLPRDFLNTFGHLKIAKVLYEGNFNEQFIGAVINGEFTSGEGVVAKGVLASRKNPQHGLWMTKVKTRAWLDELRRRCESDSFLATILKDNEREQGE